jgi:hypothetical protein
VQKDLSEWFDVKNVVLDVDESLLLKTAELQQQGEDDDSKTES